MHESNIVTHVDLFCCRIKKKTCLFGVWFDSDFSSSKNVQNVCKSSFVQLHDFKHVRRFLTHDAFVLVVVLLLVVGWITVTHFNSLSSIFVNYSLSKIVQLESYQLSADTLV